MKKELGAKVIRIHSILAGIPSKNISLDVDVETNSLSQLTPYFKIPVIIRKDKDISKLVLLPSEWIKIYSCIRKNALKSSPKGIADLIVDLDITTAPAWDTLDLGVEDTYHYTEAEIRWIMATLMEQPEAKIRSAKSYVLKELQNFCKERGFNKK
jgi:hypothetical protein